MHSSLGDYTKPIRPPRVARAPKETTGHLMKIISTLSISQDNEDRDKEKRKLEKEFHDSDKKLNCLVEDHGEDISNIMQAFRKVHLNIGIAELKCEELKEMLMRCKKLLHCKRYELKKLWLEAVEHKRVLAMLNEIEVLTGVSENLETLLKNKKYLEATELLVSSIHLLGRSVESVEALKELKTELFAKREELHQILVQELHTHLYLTTSNYILKRFKEIGSPHQRKHTFCAPDTESKLSLDGYPTYWSHTSWTSSFWNDTFWFGDISFKEVDEVNKASILNLVNCIALLHRIPETVEILKDRSQQELLAIARRTAQQVAESSQNVHTSNQPSLLGSLINREQQQILLDLLELIFEQFKYVSRNHTVLLQNLQQKVEKEDSDQFKYEIAEIWSKIQAVLEIFIGEYVDIHNPTGSEPAVQPAFTKVTSAADVSAFFLRKRSQKPKDYSLFKYDRSSHAISMKTYLQEQREALKEKGEIDAFDSEKKVFICLPSFKNITTIHRPLAKFIIDMEKEQGMEPGVNCPLYDFMSGCGKVFMRHTSPESTVLVENIVKGAESWKAVTDQEQLRCLGMTTSVLYSAMCIDRLVREFKELAYSLPRYCSFFMHMICTSLIGYQEFCQNSYLSLIQQPSEDKRIISSAWARDSDISRLLRSLPNYTNLKETDFFDCEESPEEVRLRNKKESEILIANLSGDTFISQHEILADTRRLHNLGLLHESLDWLGFRLSNFLSSFPNKCNALTTAGTDDELGPIPDTVISHLISLQNQFQVMADTSLLVLHLEVRVHCFYYLQPLAVHGCYATRLDSQEPDPEILKLNADLTKIDESLQLGMKPSKTKYIFEGLGELISTILINSVNKIKRINENGVNKMLRNIFALQQNLTGITMFREVALDRARDYFDLLKKSSEEILNLIVEQGPQFQELEYSSVFHLLQRSQPCSDASTNMNLYLERLHQILNEVAVSV